MVLMARAQSQRLRFDSLMRFFRRCRREALRCREAKAYIAGCVLLGAALESALLSMTRIYQDQVYRRGRRVAEKWDLGGLIDLADACGWLDDTGLRAAKKIQVHRNLVHPGRSAGSVELPRIDRRTFDARLRDFERVMDNLTNYVLYGSPVGP